MSDTKNNIIEVGPEYDKDKVDVEKRIFECDGLQIRILPTDTSAKVTWRVGDKEGVFDNDFIWTIAWMIANDEMRDKLIPVKIEEKRVFYKTIKLRLKNDMKAGSEVISRIKFTVPLELLVKYNNNTGIVVPGK